MMIKMCKKLLLTYIRWVCVQEKESRGGAGVQGLNWDPEIMGMLFDFGKMYSKCWHNTIPHKGLKTLTVNLFENIKKIKMFKPPMGDERTL